MPYTLKHFLKAFRLMGGHILPRLTAILIGIAIGCCVVLIVELFLNYFWYATGFVAFVAFCLWLWFSLEEVKREEPR